MNAVDEDMLRHPVKIIHTGVNMLLICLPVWPDDMTTWSKSFQNIVTAAFAWKMIFFKVDKKCQIFGLLCKRNCHQDLSKIAQSGHSAAYLALSKSYFTD